jgi:hypothetical protein
LAEFLGMAMLFPGAFWLLGSRFAFLGMERMFPGTPALFLGTFWLLGKGPSFLGTLRWFLGIVLGDYAAQTDLAG